MLEDLILKLLERRYPGIRRPGSRFIVHGMAFVLFCVMGLIAMMLWSVFSPLPKPTEFVERSGIVRKVLLKEIKEKNLKFLWLYLDQEPKLYVHAFSKGPEDLLQRIAVGDTLTVTIRKGDLRNPKKADAISVKSSRVSVGSIEDHIRKKAESKKYAWLMLLPAALGLYFLNVLREKDLEKGWEIEREKNRMLH